MDQSEFQPAEERAAEESNPSTGKDESGSSKHRVGFFVCFLKGKESCFQTFLYNNDGYILRDVRFWEKAMIIDTQALRKKQQHVYLSYHGILQGLRQ